MVFLVLTRDGLDDLASHIGRLPSPLRVTLWVNKGLLSDAEMAGLRSAGAQVVDFEHHVDPKDRSAIEAAANIVREHHPGARIWVEHAVAAREEAIGDRTHRTQLASPVREGPDWKRTLETVVATADDLFDRARMRVGRRAQRNAPLMIVPYRGYVSGNTLSLNGRVLRDEGLLNHEDAATAWRNLVELYKRMASREVPGARVRVRFQDSVTESVADREGYFNIEMSLPRPLQAPGWHSVQLELIDLPSGRPVRAEGEVLVPGSAARFAVISDIDDTVVWTNVTNKLRMLLMLSRSNAYTRKPFKGVAAFYRALRDGVTGNEGNPVFYVSSSPWNLYTPLVEFMRVQGIPKGPLFLKDFGDHTLFASRDHHNHKLASIEQILHAFPHLQFILIGDSGEQDPEIYSQVVKLFPKRIRVVYIRNVNPDPSRIEAIDRLIDDVRQSGAQLVLAPDSEFAATHAAAEGLISSAALEAVRTDKKEDEASSELQEAPAGGG